MGSPVTGEPVAAWRAFSVVAQPTEQVANQGPWKRITHNVDIDTDDVMTRKDS